MHEMPMVMNILREMDRQAQEQDLKKITEIRLAIGELSDMVPEIIQTYFDTAAEGHVCAGAKLLFERRPVMLTCNTCGTVYPHERSFDCPRCGGHDCARVRGTGTECTILSCCGE